MTKDKRFDARVKERETFVRAHERRLVSGKITTVSEYLRLNPGTGGGWTTRENRQTQKVTLDSDIGKVTLDLEISPGERISALDERLQERLGRHHVDVKETYISDEDLWLEITVEADMFRDKQHAANQIVTEVQRMFEAPHAGIKRWSSNYDAEEKVSWDVIEKWQPGSDATAVYIIPVHVTNEWW
jgi:hypothetical protein